jgi:hypothetical protein
MVTPPHKYRPIALTTMAFALEKCVDMASSHLLCILSEKVKGVDIVRPIRRHAFDDIYECLALCRL